MNVGELKELLQYVDDDVEVRIAQQPSWPFEYSISGAEVIDLNQPDPEEMTEPMIDEEGFPTPESIVEPQEIFYISEGSQLGYLPGVVSRHLGWR